MFLVSGTFILSNFDFGFRVTADQRDYTYWALTLSPWDWIKKGLDAAHHQGRIGATFTLPLQILGGWLGDTWFYPFLCVGIFTTIFLSFYAWVQLISGSKVALGLSAVYLALLPAGLHHWLPNAYPMQFLPLAFGLLCRLAFQRLYGSPRFGLWRKGLLASGIFAGAISYELSLVLLICMALFEVYAYLFIETRRRKQIAPGYLLWQGGIAAAALASYLLYRFLSPSNYPGNQLPIDVFSAQAKVTLLHLYYAMSIERIGTADWGRLVAGRMQAAEAVVVLIGLSTVIATSRLEALHWRSLAMLGAIIAMLTTIPIAANHKFLDWCLGPIGECTYIDARFSLLGIGLIIFYAARGLLRTFAFRFVFAAVIGTIGALTFLANTSDPNDQLRLVNAADSAARAYVCKVGKQEADDAGLIERLIMIDNSSPWKTFDSKHDDSYKVKYWKIYLKHLRDSSLFWLCG